MKETVNQAINQLEAKLEELCSNPLGFQELDEVQKADLAKLPRWLTAVYQGKSLPMPPEVFRCVELHEALLRRWDLLEDIKVVIRTMLFELPYEASPSRWCLWGDFERLFNAAFVSDLFHETALEWLRSNIVSEDWQACLIYCGIVSHALSFPPIFEANTWGAPRREQAKLLYSVLLVREICLARWKTAMEAMVLEGFPERAVNCVADWEFQEELFVRARERVWRTSEPEWNQAIHAKQLAETKQLLEEMMPRLQAMLDCEKRREERQRGATGSGEGQTSIGQAPPGG